MLQQIGGILVDPEQLAAVYPTGETATVYGCGAVKCVLLFRSGYEMILLDEYDEIKPQLIAAGALTDDTPDPPPELTEEQLLVLRDLQTAGFAWLARDVNQALFAYQTKPVKTYSYWGDSQPVKRAPTRIRAEFPFITSEDEEPWSIQDLLN